jgi:hypothetical protein
MNAYPPHVRRRGYFISEATEAGEAETGEYESSEGLRLRVRIVRPLKKHVAISRHAAPHRGLPATPDTTTRPGSAASHAIKSATATGTRRP